LPPVSAATATSRRAVILPVASTTRSTTASSAAATRTGTGPPFPPLPAFPPFDSACGAATPLGSLPANLSHPQTAATTKRAVTHWIRFSGNSSNSARNDDGVSGTRQLRRHSFLSRRSAHPRKWARNAAIRLARRRALADRRAQASPNSRQAGAEPPASARFSRRSGRVGRPTEAALKTTNAPPRSS